MPTRQGRKGSALACAPRGGAKARRYAHFFQLTAGAIEPKALASKLAKGQNKIRQIVYSFAQQYQPKFEPFANLVRGLGGRKALRPYSALIRPLLRG